MSLKYTTDQLEFLRDQYPLLELAELTRAFNTRYDLNKSVGQVRSTLKNHKFTCGRDKKFKSGHVSWSKGLKGVLRGSTTSFKPGNVPANLKGLYSERICSKDGYVLIKVPERNPYTGAPTRFMLKHHWIWKQANRTIPKGHALLFKDGNKLNVSLKNLVCIERALALALNRHAYKDAPAELKETIFAAAQLEVALFSRLKRNTQTKPSDSSGRAY